MSDAWSDLIFEPASFDGIDLDILSVDDDLSNELIRHTYPFRAGAVLQNAGAVPRTTSCEIWFFERDQFDEDDHLERLRQFSFAAASAEALTFIHPLFGRYQAMVEGFQLSASATERDLVKVQCTFVEAGLDPAAFEAVTDDSVGAGVAGVIADSAELENQLELLSASNPTIEDELAETPVTVTTDAIAIAEGWRDTDGITQRQINLELNQITNEIELEVDRLELATNVANYPTWVQFVRLHGAIRRAADLAIRTAPKLTTHVVAVTAPLLAIMATIYGGSNALDKYTRTLELNNIDNPARVPAGTELTIEL